ncbi:MAG: ribosome biogenesis GTPase Der [Candidatus Falkowbacteria bacterium]|nr:ribosome biogenesis GTPase Der [Candidatus Falkowbacteria bacterium]
MSLTKPLVVIFGRTNVGKSTLFNCLVEKKQALVSNTPGTTRDSNLATVGWQGKTFSIVDTGGFMDFDFLRLKKIKAETIDELVQKQARDYLKKADLILFLVDARDGLLPQDMTMAMIIKKIIPDKKKIVLVANKVEKLSIAPAAGDFYRLGLGDVSSISALTGAGTGDLLDIILKKIKAPKDKVEVVKKEIDKTKSPSVVRVAIIGKPNVGKSSLINAILGYSRVIVSPIPHTTREPQSARFTYKKSDFEFVDTAGITKHGHKVDNLEKYSMDKSLAAVQKANVAILVMDISEPLTKQDARLVEEIFDRHKSLILVANKWDLAVDRDPKKYTHYINSELPFATHAPIQFLSAKNKVRINQLLDLIIEVNNQRYISIPDSALDRLLKSAVKKHRPTKGRGTKYPRVYEFKQAGVNPPSFMVQIGPRESLAESYLRFLENQLRAKFGFIGTPISMWVKKGRDIHGLHNS